MRLVLLHALPFDGTVWANPDWPDDCLAPTLYGLGESLEDWAAGVLDLAGDGPLVVAGNSVGGSCALEVARLAPDRVAAIVLIGAKAGHRPEPAYRDAAIRLLTDAGMAGAWPKYWAPLFGKHVDPAVLEAARRLAFAQDIEAVIRGVRAFHSREDRSAFARSWDKPLVVVRGDQDPTAAAAPRGRLHVIEDSGHYVGLEQPEALDRILRAVVREVDA